MEIGISRLNQLFVVDEMPPDLRQCVHDYGYPIVDAFTHIGVRNPKHIRHLINLVLCGLREKSQSGSKGSGLRSVVDDLLLQSGSGLSSRALASALYQHNIMIVPSAPNRTMIDASMAAVDWSRGKLTKSLKHSIRLTSALRAAAKDHWGFQ